MGFRSLFPPCYLFLLPTSHLSLRAGPSMQSAARSFATFAGHSQAPLPPSSLWGSFLPGQITSSSEPTNGVSFDSTFFHGMSLTRLWATWDQEWRCSPLHSSSTEHSALWRHWTFVEKAYMEKIFHSSNSLHYLFSECLLYTAQEHTEWCKAVLISAEMEQVSPEM